MQKKIVAITGTIGSGKDTLSNAFIEDGWHKFAFAGALKDAVSVIFGWDRDMLEGETQESRQLRDVPDEYWSTVLGREVTPRYILQHFGTDVVRKHFCDDIWIASLQKKINTLDADKIIITDCRFPNELSLIRNNNGTVIEVQREVPVWYNEFKQYNQWIDGNPSGVAIENPSNKYSIHESETAWIGRNNPEFTIYNDSTVKALAKKAQAIIKLL